MIEAILILNAALLALLVWATLTRTPNRQFVDLQPPGDFDSYEAWRSSQFDAAEYMLRSGVVITLTEWISLAPSAQEDIALAAGQRDAVARMVAITDMQSPENALANLSTQIEEVVPGATAEWMAADAKAEGQKLSNELRGAR